MVAAEERGPLGPRRAACRLAVEVARAGDALDPWVPPPTALVPILRFRRLNATAYETIARVIDDDDAFRERVAALAAEDDVGRAGWLWLARPEGWEQDPAWLAAQGSGSGPGPSPAPGVAARGEANRGDDPDPDADAEPVSGPASDVVATRPGAESARASKRASRVDAAVERHRRQAEQADERRRKAVDQLVEVRRQRDEAQVEAEALADRLGSLEVERTEAVRALKAAEAQLTKARHDRKVARQATREAEAELQALKRVGGPARAELPTPAPASTPATASSSTPSSRPAQADGWDREAAARAMAAAAQAAEQIGRSLSAASAALAPDQVASTDRRGQPQPGSEGAGPAEPRTNVTSGAGRRSRPRRVRRAAPRLPPGLFDGSAEAHRHLLLSGEALVLVDGYNVARCAWPDLSPEEDRRRLIRLLEGLQARSRGPITVVFDGQTGEVAPQASRSVHVAFSATGVTADDEIATRLDGIVADQPVVVVSSDRAVAADARRQGAVALSSADFLAATGG